MMTRGTLLTPPSRTCLQAHPQTPAPQRRRADDPGAAAAGAGVGAGGSAAVGSGDHRSAGDGRQKTVGRSGDSQILGHFPVFWLSEGQDLWDQDLLWPSSLIAPDSVHLLGSDWTIHESEGLQMH